MIESLSNMDVEHGGQQSDPPLSFEHRLECMQPARLAELGLPVLLAIARRHSARVIYPVLQNLDRSWLKIIAACLSDDQMLAEIDFWDAVQRMHLFVQAGGPQRLVEAGMRYKPGDDDESAYLARVYTESFADVCIYMGLVLSSSQQDITGKTFHVYASVLDANDLQEKAKALTETNLTTSLLSAFGTDEYGPYWSIKAVGGPVTAFAIEHGAHRKAAAVVGPVEKRRLRNDRALKADAIAITPSNACIWVRCSSAKDSLRYAEAVTPIIGVSDPALARRSLDLSKFLKKGLREELRAIAERYTLARIEVKAFQIVKADHEVANRTAKDSSVGCLTELYDRLTVIHPSSRVKSVKLRLVLSPDGKAVTDLELRPASLKISTGGNLEQVAAVLFALGVWNESEKL